REGRRSGGSEGGGAPRVARILRLDVGSRGVGASQETGCGNVAGRLGHASRRVVVLRRDGFDERPVEIERRAAGAKEFTRRGQCAKSKEAPQALRRPSRPPWRSSAPASRR